MSNYIGNVISYIERRLAEDLGPEAIARRHFVSLSQLYRDFYAYTGHSIKEYVRRRRISNACEKIKVSDMPLGLIADESGCRTQQAFHKQFKSIVGMTPLEYKKSDAHYSFYPSTPSEISVAVKVGVENIPECTATRYYDPQLSGIEDRAIASLGEITGRVFGRNGKQIGSQFCYELSVGRDAPDATSGRTGTHATCTVDYHERDINAAWNYLYNIWLSASMFEQSDDGYFEEYLFKGGKPHRLKLYIPVRKRKAARHITISDVPEMSFVIARATGPDAERRASENVMDFLQERYPLLVRNTQRFYLCAHDGLCECGVECADSLRLPEGSDLEIIRHPAGRYAVLPDDRLGDPAVGAAKIAAWLANNAIAHEAAPVFAVYETENGRYDTGSVTMKLYKFLKS